MCIVFRCSVLKAMKNDQSFRSICTKSYGVVTLSCSRITFAELWRGMYLALVWRRAVLNQRLVIIVMAFAKQEWMT